MNKIVKVLAIVATATIISAPAFAAPTGKGGGKDAPIMLAGAPALLAIGGLMALKSRRKKD
jgi:LPXTG-motif cell wall-anchored protein